MNNATNEDYLREEAQLDMKNNCGVMAKYHTHCYEGVHSEPSTGCWIDGRWGHYGISRLVSIAQDLGMEISDLDESALWAYNNNEEEFQDEATGEFYSASDWLLMQGGLCDEAEDWLNENVAQPGYMFGWSEGEFFLMPYSWWGDEDAY